MYLEQLSVCIYYISIIILSLNKNNIFLYSDSLDTQLLYNGKL